MLCHNNNSINKFFFKKGLMEDLIHAEYQIPIKHSTMTKMLLAQILILKKNHIKIINRLVKIFRAMLSMQID